MWFNAQQMLEKAQIIDPPRWVLQDVSKSVTKLAVRESRAQDLRNEIVNSEKWVFFCYGFPPPIRDLSSMLRLYEVCILHLTLVFFGLMLVFCDPKMAEVWVRCFQKELFSNFCHTCKSPFSKLKFSFPAHSSPHAGICIWSIACSSTDRLGVEGGRERDF